MIELRPVAETDCDRLRVWRNSPAVARWMFTDHVIGPDEHRAWFDGIDSDNTRRHWIITMNGEDVGAAHLSEIEHRLGRCSFGLYLASDAARGKGVGATALFLLLEEAFTGMNMSSVWCEALADNEAALRLYDDFGLRPVAQLRDHALKMGQWHDAVRLEIERPMWLDLRSRLRDDLMERGLIV